MKSIYVGINVGSISIKITTLDDERKIITNKIINHKGQPRDILEKIDHEYQDPKYTIYYSVSGHSGHIAESRAIEAALQHQDQIYDAVISLGGETFAVFLVKNNRIQNVLSHNRCAAGSGEFLVQQVARLNLSLDEAIELAMTGKSIKLASRCSVHCKSDITHKLNRQEANINDILWSLHESMAQKIVSLLDKCKSQINSILVIGGVSQNKVMITILEKLIPEAEIEVSSQSSCFESFGTALLAKQFPEYTTPVFEFKPLFQSLPMLSGVEDLVTIIQPEELLYDQSIDKINEPLILGIDGGSTTTKAVLITKYSNKIISSYYTKTNGDPVAATKECITSIIAEVGNQKVSLVTTTGSARELIGAFVGTPAVYNEISAHATGALAFDGEVDTIFEIGGQDAKYIFIENGAPIDYAMNAACSAGTGSFLEESAQGDLGISVYNISSIALESPSPIQFQADCAAFINSDIRSALQEGYSKLNIIGGLVSSIVTNYLTKVKGRRRVGKKLFFQGGVAKNNSVAYAFAQATNKEIIVPPYPELMGAYGVALLALEYTNKNDVEFQSKTLEELTIAEMKFLGDFICRSCDNYCTINRYNVAGRKFPFGGRCSKYENQWKNTAKQEDAEDFIERRNKLIFSVAENDDTTENNSNLTIGIPRALTTHSLLPLYYTFFKELRIKVVISGIDQDGEFKTNAPFCFPSQIAHGAVLDLLKQDQDGKISLDYVFFPQIQKMPNEHKRLHTENSYLCPVSQASPFILKKAFPELKYLTPTLDFLKGYASTSEMVEMAVSQLGIKKNTAERAYKKAVSFQMRIEKKLQDLGQEALSQALASNKPAIIVAGRSYNAFPKETSQSVSIKLASKGIIAIPYDCLGINKSSETTWYFSNLILDAVKLSKQHENLFILYISNFGCNIDSFTQEYVKLQIGTKPYLKLDIDSHTADAGTQTRLEAFLEIISNYNQMHNKSYSDFQATKVITSGKKFFLRLTNNELVSIKNDRLKVYFPSFSKFHNDTLSMVMRWLGINAPNPLELSIEQLNTGLQYTAGTECLPLPLYLGQILEVYQKKKPEDILGFYIFEIGAPCVIASYADIISKFILDQHLENTFVYLPSNKNNYLGLEKIAMSRFFPFAIGLADVMTEINNVLSVVGYKNSISKLRLYWDDLITCSQSKMEFDTGLDDFLLLLQDFQIKKPIEECARVLVTVDFFVRFDEFFYQGLVNKYAANDIILKPVDFNELLIYAGYYTMHQNQGTTKEVELTGKSFLKTIPKCYTSIGRQKLGSMFSIKVLEYYERKIREKFRSTGLIYAAANDLESVLGAASNHLDLSIYGESVLTVGKGIETLNSEYDGMLVLGPFSCLPFRISEAILKPICLEKNFPLLTFETDARSILPAFLRLVDIHIQQIIRQQSSKNSSNLIVLSTI